MALAGNPREALLWALCDLEENNFKIFKFHLRDRTLLTGQGLARGELEGLSRVDLASRLILMYGAQDAVKVVLKVLKVMNLLELVDKLSGICLNGEYSSGQGEVRVALGLPLPHAISRNSHACHLCHLSLLSSALAWAPQGLRVLVVSI